MKAAIEIRDVTETQAFGRSAVKTYYNMYVNDEFYRGYRYSEIHKLKSNLKKVDPAQLKSAPKYPEKARVSIGVPPFPTSAGGPAANWTLRGLHL